ncbi:MAG TPA: undecaprenyldiphospho-muramoylpentapeptide beta-N-acetylglucosaminyltransferase [Candidatus Kapabacteria bacterium]|nr:undecaprenyldiphospho-muramoylpentapeptide beta-N-acetylglucosaminyltransferase [Candidatus Kapabacteria bacterium]
MSTIVIASGGTGGHLYPTVAIAEAIRASHPELRIVFIGTNDRIESREVPRLGFEFFPIEIKAPGRSLMSLAKFPFKYYKAFRRSKKILAEVNASAFLGGGAYLSVPVAFAAKRRGIPIALLEINAVAGRANRVLAKDADKIFISYKEAESQFTSSVASKLELIGTPVRDSLAEKIDVVDARKHFGLDPARKTLLVFGGSLGARSLNAAMMKSVRTFLDHGMNIIWQTGSSANIGELTKEFGNADRICIREFISEMPEAYAGSDVVVARAGASTLAELSTLGKPAILVPYPLAAANHQERNALAYSNRGAARVIADNEIGARLETEVLSLMSDDMVRSEMAKKMFSPENITARNVVAEYLVSCVRSRT